MFYSIGFSFKQTCLGFPYTVDSAGDWLRLKGIPSCVGKQKKFSFPIILIGTFKGRVAFDQNSGNSGCGSEWNKHFPEFRFEILHWVSSRGWPKIPKNRNNRKILICSIRPFRLGPSFYELGN